MDSTKQLESFSVSIPKKLAKKATSAAKELGMSKAMFVKQVLADKLQDIEDLKIVEARRGEKSIPWEKVKEELGL